MSLNYLDSYTVDSFKGKQQPESNLCTFGLHSYFHILLTDYLIKRPCSLLFSLPSKCFGYVSEWDSAYNKVSESLCSGPLHSFVKLFHSWSVGLLFQTNLHSKEKLCAINIDPLLWLCCHSKYTKIYSTNALKIFQL